MAYIMMARECGLADEYPKEHSFIHAEEGTSLVGLELTLPKVEAVRYCQWCTTTKKRAVLDQVDARVDGHRIRTQA